MNTIPTDPVQALLGQTALKNSLFIATSRYFGLEPLTIKLQGRTYIYLPRRFVPLPSQFQLVDEHTVVQGERLDHIAAHYLGDPTLFWRLCDANNAMRPESLTEAPGKTLKVTLPEGTVGTAV
jgi:hypothetical protein